MRRKMGRATSLTLVAALLAALVAIPAALAAYASARLDVRQVSGGVVFAASIDPADDPTASVRIVVPSGTQVASTQAPGTVLGSIRATARAADAGGASVPLEGQLAVAAEGEVSELVRAQCTQGAPVLASWLATLAALGQTVRLPVFLVGTAGTPLATLGPALVQVCFPPPDLPPGSPGRAPFGATFFAAELTIQGVFSRVLAGTWVSLWTPYVPGAGEVAIARTIAAPMALAPGQVTVAARRRGAGALVSGRVAQAGAGRPGATVTVFGGQTRTTLKRLGTARVGANGAYAFTARSGTFFRAVAAAAKAPAPAVCTRVSSMLPEVACVNPAASGFTAQSPVTRKR